MSDTAKRDAPKFHDYKVKDPETDPLLPMRMIRLSETAADYLRTLASPEYRSHGVSLTGSPASVFKTLIKKGLITTDNPGVHSRHTTYTLTKLGAALEKVISAPIEKARRDRLEEGQREQQRQEELRRWGTDDRSVSVVRAELFKRVTRPEDS